MCELDGSIIHRRLACNKEGFNQNRQKSTRVRVRKREIKREGCMAKMNVKREKPGKYVITKFVKEHNHPLFVTSGKDQPYTRIVMLLRLFVFLEVHVSGAYVLMLI
ncbi:hypothetical protein Gotur_006743 [Gossypium turneri]